MRIRLATLLLAALAPASASAQQPVFLHDDLSGTIKEQYVQKADTRYDHAGANLRFDIDYTYKASLLMGEPVVVCSAQISNPSGSITFEHDGQLHTVQIDSENGKLLTPYNVDYAIAYKSIHSDNTYYIARCNGGIPGSWANDALNVPASPDWDDFLCWTGGGRPRRPDPMPDSLGENWCRTIGGAESRTLDENKAKGHFQLGNFRVVPAYSGKEREPTMRAMSVHVASFAVNFNDVIFAETKKLSAQKIARRKFDQTEQLRGSLPLQPGGAVGQAARQIDAAIDQARSQSDPRQQARTLQEALRDVFSIQEQAPTTEFLQLKNAIVKLLSADEEREFIAQMKQTLADAQTANDAVSQSVAAFLDGQRNAATGAPTFAFASGATGPEATKPEIQKIEGHDGKPVYRVLFHPDGKRLLSTGADGTLRFWDIASGTEIWRKNNYRSTDFEFSADGRQVFVLDFGSVAILDAESGSEEKTIAVTDGLLKTLVVSPDGRYLFCNMLNKTVVWDIEKEKKLDTLPTKGLWLRNVNEGGSLLIFIDGEDNLVLKNIGGDTLLSHHIGNVNEVIFDKVDNQYLIDNKNIVVRVNGEIHFTTYDEPLTSPRLPPIVGGKISAFAASGDGRFVLYGNLDGEVRLVDRSADSSARLLGLHDRIKGIGSASEDLEPKDRDKVHGVAISADGTLAASAGADGTIRIWGAAQP